MTPKSQYPTTRRPAGWFRRFCGVACVAAVAVAAPVPTTIAAPKPGRHPTPHYHIKNFVSVGPFYNPHTKSYFELRVEHVGHAGNWKRAASRARDMSHLGVRGRLAIIRDRDTMRWVNDTFTIREATHIGLRLWCAGRDLIWPDGTKQERRSFAPWARPWYLNPGIRCKNQRITYMGVAIIPTPSGLRWQASGRAKAYRYFLVEYPTGGRTPARYKPSGDKKR